VVLVWGVVGVEVGGCVVGYWDCALREVVALFVGVWERFGLHLIGVMWIWKTPRSMKIDWRWNGRMHRYMVKIGDLGLGLGAGL
jgi:hypothetical protein